MKNTWKKGKKCRKFYLWLRDSNRNFELLKLVKFRDFLINSDRNSDRNSGKDLGRDPGRNSGKDSGRDPGRNSDRDLGRFHKLT